MLVLTRKKFETIQIGTDITIKVIRTGRTNVKIGIEAPNDVRVLRGELCETEDEVDGEAVTLSSDQDEGDDLFGCSDQFPYTVDGFSQAV